MDWNDKIYPSDIWNWIKKWSIWQGIKFFYDEQKKIIKERKAKSQKSDHLDINFPDYKRRIKSPIDRKDDRHWNNNRPLSFSEREKIRLALDKAMKRLDNEMKGLDFKDIWDVNK